jgi:glutathione S-transferase
MTILLHELALERGILSSPYCWMVRFALARKGLAYQTAATSFTGIRAICGGAYKEVPVLEDGPKIIGDSWAIAQYLEDAYPAGPSLFGGAAGRAYAGFMMNFFLSGVIRPAIKVMAAEIYNKVQPEDRAYYHASRAQRFGVPIADFTAAPIGERLAALRVALEPLRAVVRGQSFLSGDAPLYPDYIAAGFFLWWRAASPEQVIAPDDPLLPWFERMLGLVERIRAESTCSWQGP